MAGIFQVRKHGKWWRGPSPYRRTLTLSEEGVATCDPDRPESDHTNFWPWASVIGFSISQDAAAAEDDDQAHVCIVLRRPAPLPGFEELKLSVPEEHLATMGRIFDEHLRNTSSGLAPLAGTGVADVAPPATPAPEDLISSAVSAARHLLKQRESKPGTPVLHAGSTLPTISEESHEAAVAEAVAAARRSWEAKAASRAARESAAAAAAAEATLAEARRG